MSKRINLILDDLEERNLLILLTKYGGKPPEYFRFLLKLAYEKEFGGYKSDKVRTISNLPEEVLTPEQKCEKAGGAVFTENGTLKCRLPQNDDRSMFLSFPIEMIDKYI